METALTMAEVDALNKQDLVLLHGWGMNQGVWQQVKAYFSDTVNVITLDLPGFGSAEHCPEPYQLEKILPLLAAQIPDNSLVAGWSLGGLVAIGLAVHFPQKVRQLGLIAATPCFMAKPDWPGMQLKVMQQFSTALHKDLPLTIERFLAIQAMGSDSARADIKALKQSVMSFPQARAEALHGGLALLSELDLREAFSHLTMPVTGCFGRLDSLIPASVIPLLQQLQPTARFHSLAKASHAPFISHPDAFEQWLTQWLLSAQ